MEKTLAQDKVVNKHIYGKKGDKVKVISDRGEAVIVEHLKTKEKFSVRKENLHG